MSSCPVLLASEVSGLCCKVHRRRRPAGGCTRGAAAPLVGGAAARGVPALLAGATRVAAWGEPARPGFPPQGETGKGALQFLAAAGQFFTPPSADNRAVVLCAASWAA